MLEKCVEERTGALQQALSITRGTLDSTIDGILVVNNENNLIDYNPKLISIWEIPAKILNERNVEKLFDHIKSQLLDPSDFVAILPIVSNPSADATFNVFKNIHGKIIEHYSQPYLMDNKIAGRIWSFRDITIRSQLESKIKHQATHDELTGLPNRPYLVEHLQNTICQAKTNNTKFALLFLDIDRFKLINDSYNHKAGDDLLIEVAARIKRTIREGDFVARLGGDEFVIIVSDVKSPAQLKKIANKLSDNFHKPYSIDGHETNVSVSIGIAVYPDHAVNLEKLIQHSDMAMYRSKELGGNQFQFYSSSFNKIKSDELALEADLHNAIKTRNSGCFISLNWILPKISLYLSKL